MHPASLRVLRRVANAAWALAVAAGLHFAPGIFPDAQSQTAAETVVFGALVDGDDERVPVVDQYREEIVRVLGTEFDAQFPPEKIIRGGWTSDSIASGLDTLLSDQEIDIVLALGFLSSAHAASRPTLPKPTLAPFVIFPELQGIPVERRRGTPVGGDIRREYRVSGRENLAYVIVRDEFRPSVDAFLEIVPFQRLAVLVTDAVLQAMPTIREGFREAVRPLEIEVDFVPHHGRVEDTVSRISPGTQAVYVGALLQSSTDIGRLAELLVERKLPSFSTLGRAEVDAGLMASTYLDTDLDRLARRTAINAQRILEGEPAAELPADFQITHRLSINMATARAVDARLTWATLTEAELLHDSDRTAARRLSLVEVVQEAERVNLDLAAADRTVAAGIQDVRLARANLRPQIEVFGTDVVIDTDRAAASFGSQGKNQLSGSLGVSQLLYSEQARAGYTIEQRLQEARELERAQLRLDVILDAAHAYLDVLRTKAAERIRRSNLEVTRRNLERARTRLQLGDASPGEVFRWQAELASNRKELIAASAVRNQAEIEVNRTLNRPLEEPFETIESSIDDPALSVNYESVRPFVDNQQAFRLFRAFMSARAIEASPELGQIDRAAAAQERLILAAKRALYIPTVAAQASVDTFHNSGTAGAADLGDAVPEGLEFPSINSLNWSIGVNAALPLFQGGALRARRTQAQIELDELTLMREASRLRIDQRVRSAMHAAMASWAGIDLAREAAEAASNNFRLVADGYSEGAIDIITLLDAQNQALSADFAAATAVYDFLSDMMAVQRAAGHFDFFRSAEDRERFLDAMRDYFAEHGYAP